MLCAQQLVATLTPTTSGDVSVFANEIAIDGERVLVGALKHAYLYQRPTDPRAPWSQTQVLDLLAGPFSFDYTVALDGDVALLGAESAWTMVQQSGEAYFLRRDPQTGEYRRTQRVWPDDAEMHDAFGGGVALGAGLAFIGADNDNHNGKQSTGTVTLYQELDGDPGVFVQTKKFAPDDLRPGDGFGGSLALDEDYLVVGGRREPYVYFRHAGGADQWGQVAKLSGTTGSSDAVAIDGGTILVGSSSRVAPGLVGVYDRDPDSGDWGLTKLLTPPDSHAGDQYGYSLDVHGDMAIVGRRSLSNSDSALGDAFVYRRDQGGEDNWGLVTRLTAPDPGVAEYFATSVGLMGDLALVGSVGFGAGSPGSVYVFAVPEPSTLALMIAGLILCGRRPSLLEDLSIGGKP